MTKAVVLTGYAEFLTTLKERILAARATAARAVNRELVLLHWDIGRGLVGKQDYAGWGDGVVRRLAADLCSAFPGMRGFSESSLWRIEQFYRTHMAPEFLAQAVRDLVASVPWGHLTQPSIGIILCAEKDDIEVEFALKTKQNPIGVAEYQLQTRLPAEFQGRLPTARQLAAAVRDVLPSRK